MNNDDHIALLRDGVPAQPGGSVWADLGAGGGAFTLALADLLGPDGDVIAVDRDARSLVGLERELQKRFPATRLHTFVADFTRPLGLPPLDGLVLANSLHFVPDRDKGPTLELLRAALQPGGRLLLVEYNAERGNRWVPHPLSYRKWSVLADEHGFAETRLLARRPSRFLGEIFSAVSVRLAITVADRQEQS